MANTGFYFNSGWCVGCRTCQIVCKEKNSLEIGILYRKVRDFETGSFPRPGYYHLSSSCNHCEAPACLGVCPAGAISKDADSGIVLIDKTLCIGCKLCIDACPYDVPQFLEAELKVGKCDFCQDLLGIDENPVCVDSCPQFALEYGDINELKTKHSDAVTDLPLLPNSLQTGPSSIISPRPAMLDAKYSEKAI